MTILYRNRRIKSFGTGYMVQTKIGKQWKEAIYPTSLSSAAEELFKLEVRKLKHNVDLETENAQKRIKSLIDAMHDIKNELIQAIEHNG